MKAIAPSAMHQLSILDKADLPEGGEFTPDDYETPDEVAELLADHVNLSDRLLPIDRTIVECSAGTGQIAQYLPDVEGVTVHCVEPKASRVAQGKLKAPHCQWHHADFLTWQGVEPGTVDLIVTNPPFSQIVEFICRGFELLRSNGRLVLLMPIDTFCQVNIVTPLNERLPGYLLSTYPLVGRVSYIKEGKREAGGKRKFEAIFVIRKYPHPDQRILWHDRPQPTYRHEEG